MCVMLVNDLNESWRLSELATARWQWWETDWLFSLRLKSVQGYRLDDMVPIGLLSAAVGTLTFGFGCCSAP